MRVKLLIIIFIIGFILSLVIYFNIYIFTVAITEIEKIDSAIRIFAILVESFLSICSIFTYTQFKSKEEFKKQMNEEFIKKIIQGNRYRDEIIGQLVGRNIFSKKKALCVNFFIKELPLVNMPEFLNEICYLIDNKILMYIDINERISYNKIEKKEHWMSIFIDKKYSFLKKNPEFKRYKSKESEFIIEKYS